MKYPIVGFTGYAGAGKSTAAAALASTHVKFSFAHPIRAMLTALGVTAHQMAEEKNVPIAWLGNKTPRQLMQTLGTEWGRQMVDESIWLNACRKNLKAVQPDVRFVCDDVRFDNEARLIHELGGVVIKIGCMDAFPMGHASEVGVKDDLVDWHIFNDKSPAFAADVKQVVLG